MQFLPLLTSFSIGVVGFPKLWLPFSANRNRLGVVVAFQLLADELEGHEEVLAVEVIWRVDDHTFAPLGLT